jgi:Transposase, Mutator family
VPARVSPADRIRGHIDELFAQDRPLPEILEEVARLGAQLLMQAALEAEVTEFLGRDRYRRVAACEDARPGSRNGYREVTVKTTAGPVALSRPKLRGTRPAPRRDQLPHPGLGRPGPGLPRLARPDHDRRRAAAPAGPAPLASRTTPPATTTARHCDPAQ